MLLCGKDNRRFCRSGGSRDALPRHRKGRVLLCGKANRRFVGAAEAAMLSHTTGKEGCCCVARPTDAFVGAAEAAMLSHTTGKEGRCRRETVAAATLLQKRRFALLLLESIAAAPLLQKRRSVCLGKGSVACGREGVAVVEEHRGCAAPTGARASRLPPAPQEPRTSRNTARRSRERRADRNCLPHDLFESIGEDGICGNVVDDVDVVDADVRRA